MVSNGRVLQLKPGQYVTGRGGKVVQSTPQSRLQVGDVDVTSIVTGGGKRFQGRTYTNREDIQAIVDYEKAAEKQQKEQARQDLEARRTGVAAAFYGAYGKKFEAKGRSELAGRLKEYGAATKEFGYSNTRQVIDKDVVIPFSQRVREEEIQSALLPGSAVRDAGLRSSLQSSRMQNKARAENLLMPSIAVRDAGLRAAVQDSTAVSRLAKQVVAAEERVERGKQAIYTSINMPSGDPTWKEVASRISSAKGTWNRIVEAGKISFETGAKTFIETGFSVPILAGRVAFTARVLVSGKPKERVKLVENFKGVPGYVVQMFNPSTVGGVINIVMTRASIYSIGKFRADVRAFNRDMANARIVSAKVEIKPLSGRSGKVQVTKAGIIEVGGKRIPFSEVSIVSKKAVATGRYNVRSIAKYKLSPNLVKQIKSKLKIARSSKVEVSKFGESEFKKGRVEGKVEPPEVMTRNVQEGTLKVGKRKFQVYGEQEGKYFKSITKGAGGSTTTEGVLSKIKKTGEIITAELKAIQKGIRELSKTEKVINLIKRQPAAINKLVSSKRASLAIERGGSSEIRPFFEPNEASVNAINRILELSDYRKLPIIEKLTAPKPRIGSTVKVPARITEWVDFGGVMEGARLLLEPKFIPILPVVFKPAQGVRSGLAARYEPMVQPTVGSLFDSKVTPAEQSIFDAGTEPVPGTSGDVTPDTASSTASDTFIKDAVYIGGSTYTFFDSSVPYITPGGLIPFPGMGAPSQYYKAGGYGRQPNPVGESFFYMSDLYSRFFGIRATRAEALSLLRPGRYFTGFEIRKIV